MDELRLNPLYYTPEHLAFRESVRRFTAHELTPHAAKWDEAGGFPRGINPVFVDLPGIPTGEP